MRGWNKLIFLGALLSVMLIISVVFSSGVIDVLTLPLGGSPASSGAPESLSPEVFVDPESFIMDYDSLPVGSTFTVHLNVSDLTDLFTWQLNMSWDSSILNVSNIIAGEFLNRVTPPNYTTSSPAPNGLGFVINVTSNNMGHTAMAESILGGVPGISGTGRLVTIEFLVLGYGCCNLTINVDGTLPTMLLNSTGDSMEFTTVNGFFKNKLNGDANGDGWVNSLDIGKINAHWCPAIGPPEWSLGYSQCVDPNNDGYINSLDVGTINANWGRGPRP